MKHNIKLPDGTIQTLDCRLGSGVFDFNGKEIFEGDRVKCGVIFGDPTKEYDGILHEIIGTILFDKGNFYCVQDDINCRYPLGNFHGFEVIGR